MILSSTHRNNYRSLDLNETYLYTVSIIWTSSNSNLHTSDLWERKDDINALDLFASSEILIIKFNFSSDQSYMQTVCIPDIITEGFIQKQSKYYGLVQADTQDKSQNNRSTTFQSW